MSHPYIDLDARQYWRTARRDWDFPNFGDVYRPKFKIDKNVVVATGGSCFAQHISRNLRQKGYNFLDVERAPSLLPESLHARFGYGLYSARYGNIYTSRQLLNIVQFAFGEKRYDEFWSSSGRFFDPLRPSVEHGGFESVEELRALRKQHYESVREMFERARVFVFTLGLTEVWLNRASEVAYPTCPGTVAGEFDAQNHYFKNLSYRDVMDDMKQVIRILKGYNSRLKFLLTVSPVPLAATAMNQHVAVAATYSKSVLRSVAGDLSERFGFVDYFPSYELVTSHLSRSFPFEPNMREVRPEAVASVMNCFFAAHEGEAASTTASTAALERTVGSDIELEAITSEVGVVCDEAVLDEFAK